MHKASRGRSAAASRAAASRPDPDPSSADGAAISITRGSTSTASASLVAFSLAVRPDLDGSASSLLTGDPFCTETESLAAAAQEGDIDWLASLKLKAAKEQVRKVRDPFDPTIGRKAKPIMHAC
jgi:hypothetical protein